LTLAGLGVGSGLGLGAGFLGTGLPTASAEPAAAKPAGAAKPTAAAAVTKVRAGEDCAALARRVYGNQPGALGHLQAKNPGLCAQPLTAGATVKTPPLAKKPTNEPARLSYVGPAVRTKTRSGWMEALPGQPVDRRMRIETSNIGGAEVNVQDKVKLQLDPNSKLVIKNLPRSAKNSGEVQLVEGTLRAGVAEDKNTAPLTVRTRGAEFKLKGDARIDAASDDRTTVSVHEGTVSVKVGGTVISIRAGQGTLILQGQGQGQGQGQPAPQPRALPTAPAWTSTPPTAPGEQPASVTGGKPFLVVSASPLSSTQPKGEVEVDFAPVAGAARYFVEIARDPSFNDRRAGGEIEAPPLRAQLLPGRYYARVSAIDSERLVGPPSPVRSFYVITLRSDASVVGVPVQNGTVSAGAQMMLVRSEQATLQLSGAGQPLLTSIDNAPAVDCRHERTFNLGPGEHRVHLSLDEAEAELLFSVAGPPPPEPPEFDAHIEMMETPVPLLSAGFPSRSMQPRTRVYALLGLGSSLLSRDLNIYRLDLGGELAILNRRLSFEVNVPLLYYTGLHDPLPPPMMTTDDNTVAIGDLSLGVKSVLVKALHGRLLFGPMLRLQLPTGSFDRTATLGRPVIIDTALGLAAQLGRFALQTTQGLPGTVSLAQNQLRWAMNYSAEVKVWRLGLVGALDAGVGLVGNYDSGAALGGGVRLRLGQWNLLTGARGGLGVGGTALFGRYYYFLGVEWAPQ
jgi:phage tail protein X